MTSKSKKNFAFLKPEKKLEGMEKEAAQARFIETGKASMPSRDHASMKSGEQEGGPRLYSSGKYKKVNIYLEPTRHTALKIEAAQRGTDISSLIRRLLDSAGIKS